MPTCQSVLRWLLYDDLRRIGSIWPVLLGRPDVTAIIPVVVPTGNVIDDDDNDKVRQRGIYIDS